MGDREIGVVPREIAEVAEALRGALPGMAAQKRMAPSRRVEDLARALDAVREWRKAAALVLLYPTDAGLAFPLTLRRADLAHHAGQISLPGGSLEAGETAEEAALREAFEEIGVEPRMPSVIGRLSPLKIPPSGFELHPIVAWTTARPDFHLEEREVAELIELPLARLHEADAVREEEWELRGVKSRVPFWMVGRHKVWGATAMVLAELAALM